MKFIIIGLVLSLLVTGCGYRIDLDKCAEQGNRL
ncbi:hypothetical protein LCGC14_2664780, partial [marine sediment metagenome]